MVGLLIWVFTVDIQLSFCCESCEVSILVGMTMQYLNVRVLEVSFKY